LILALKFNPFLKIISAKDLAAFLSIGIGGNVDYYNRLSGSPKEGFFDGSLVLAGFEFSWIKPDREYGFAFEVHLIDFPRGSLEWMDGMSTTQLCLTAHLGFGAGF